MDNLLAQITPDDMGLMRQHVKENCVVCGKKLFDYENNYLQRGNYCPTCTSWLGKKGGAKILKSWGKKEPMTIEEALKD